jgi:hypothetical protein
MLLFLGYLDANPKEIVLIIDFIQLLLIYDLILSKSLLDNIENSLCITKEWSQYQ